MIHAGGYESSHFQKLGRRERPRQLSRSRAKSLAGGASRSGIVGDKFVERAALWEQRVSAPLGDIGSETTIVAKRLASGTQVSRWPASRPAWRAQPPRTRRSKPLKVFDGELRGYRLPRSGESTPRRGPAATALSLDQK